MLFSFNLTNTMLPDYFFQVNYFVTLFASTIALIFALMTIVVVSINRPCHTIANMLTCYTAVAMILFHSLNIFSTIYALNKQWDAHRLICIIGAYLYTVFIAFICYSYLIQALSRLFFTVLYKWKYLLSWRFHWMMMIISCFVGISMPILPIYVDDGYQFEPESRICVPTTTIFFISMYVAVTVFIIPFNIITVIYGVILYRVRQSKRRVVAVTSVLGFNVHREMKLMKRMSVLLTILISGGSPYLILILWHAIARIPTPEQLYLFAYDCIPFSAAINMIVLFLMSRSVRKRVYRYIQKLLGNTEQ